MQKERGWTHVLRDICQDCELEPLGATRTPHLCKHKPIRCVLETFLITHVTVNHRS